jgi:L-amino acid N-acyltransferase YncA
VIVRPVQPGDFGAIAALTNHYIAHTSIHFGYEPVTATDLHAAWERTRDRYAQLVAIAPPPSAPASPSAPRDEREPAAPPPLPGDPSGGVGVLAGYAKTATWRERAAYTWAAEVGIYVHPVFQGRGVGKALYRALIDISRRQGFHTLVAGITMPNEPSVRLHESVGFQRVGVYRRVGWKFGHWHDAGFWEMPLRDASHEAGPLRTPEECWNGPAPGHEPTRAI